MLNRLPGHARRGGKLIFPGPPPMLIGRFRAGSGSGVGDVTAAAAFANDNRVIRSDGSGKGVQASGIILSDADFLGFANGKGLADDSGNEALILAKTASAVNEVTLTTAATGNAPGLAATGDDPNITFRMNGKGTGGVEIEGTGTNDNATAGYVGEFMESNIASGSATALTTATAKNVTSLSLTAGDWDVWGNVLFTGNAATTVTYIAGFISTVSATFPTPPNAGAYMNFVPPAGGNFAGNNTPGLLAGQRRISVSSTTTVYLEAYAEFAVNTLSSYGYIAARRVR